MSIIKIIWLVAGVGLLGSFFVLSFWGIPSPISPVEKVVSCEKILQ